MCAASSLISGVAEIYFIAPVENGILLSGNLVLCGGVCNPLDRLGVVSF